MKELFILQVVQILFALAVGAYISYRLKNQIRKVITQLMPMKKRVAEDFFHVLSRRSAITSLVLIILISGGCYFGIEVLKQQWFPEQMNTKNSMKTSMSPPQIPSTSLPKENKAVIQETQEDIPQPKSKPTTPQLVYFVQLHAFHYYSNAIQQYNYYRKTFGNQVRLVKQTGFTPYRIWIGPFSSTNAAKAFQTEHHLNGLLVKQKE